MKRYVLYLCLWAVFWNMENFFDWRPDGVSSSECEFSSTGGRHWTKSRFYAKCNATAKILLEISDYTGNLPEIVGFAEVENSFVVRSVALSSPLHKAGYRCLHFDSPDRRGIDCALIYRGIVLQSCGASHIMDSSGRVLPTRDILWAVFVGPEKERTAVLVNHHPSKVGNGSQKGRELAWERMQSLCDSLENAGVERIVSMGDFNEDLWKTGSPGTIKYHGRWEKIDGCFCRGMTAEEKVWDSPSLMVRDRKFGGMKPRRTYVGPRYEGGVSDHLPLVLRLR